MGKIIGIKCLSNEDVKEIAKKMICENYSVKRVIEITGLSSKDAEEVLGEIDVKFLKKLN